MNQELNTEALAVIAKVQKLLALAGNNDNEYQAAAASAKAMELLEAYNLSMAVVEQVNSTPGASRRKDEKRAGGLYKWQRELWQAIAELNFCMYWSIRGLQKGQSYEHRILGRQENVTGTYVMGDYLQQTIERLAREWAGDPKRYFIQDAIAYREGIAGRLVERLNEIRREHMRDDQEKRRAEQAARKSNGGAPGTSIILADVIQTEHDLNNDFVHAWEPGTTARRRAEDVAKRAAQMAAYDEIMAKMRRQQEDYDAAHPEEAAARMERARKEQERQQKRWDRNARRRTGFGRSRADTPEERRRNSSAYDSGYDKGASISLNRQTGHTDRNKLT